MADGTRHRLAQVLEDNFAETPANPQFQDIRHTTCSLGLSKDALTSEELREDRQIATFIPGANRVGGNTGTEVSMFSHDTLLEAVLLGTWAPTIETINTDIAFNGSEITGSDLPVVPVGEYVVVSGPTANVGFYEVVTSSVTSITVVGTFTTEAAGPTITVASYEAELKAGVQRRSFSIQRYFSDLQASAKPYHLFVGCEYNTMALSLAPNTVTTNEYGVVGYNLATAETETPGATHIEKTTTDVVNSFTGAIYEDGVRLCVVTELTLNLDNGIERRFVIGENDCPTPVENSIQVSNLTGQLTAYFEDSTLLDKFINGEASSLQFIFGDGITEQQWELGRIFYTGGQPDVDGPGDILLTMPFQAVLDPDDESNIVINRRSVTP